MMRTGIKERIVIYDAGEYVGSKRRFIKHGAYAGNKTRGSNLFDQKRNCCCADDATSRKRIGVAEGKFKVPDEFDLWDKEIEETFGDKI